jgi:hypothetical protein
MHPARNQRRRPFRSNSHSQVNECFNGARIFGTAARFLTAPNQADLTGGSVLGLKTVVVEGLCNVTAT